MTCTFRGRGFSGFLFRWAKRSKVRTNRDFYLVDFSGPGLAQGADKITLGISEPGGESTGWGDQMKCSVRQGGDVDVAGNGLPDHSLQSKKIPGMGVQIGQ